MFFSSTHNVFQKYEEITENFTRKFVAFQNRIKLIGQSYQRYFNEANFSQWFDKCIEVAANNPNEFEQMVNSTQLELKKLVMIVNILKNEILELKNEITANDNDLEKSDIAAKDDYRAELKLCKELIDDLLQPTRALRQCLFDQEIDLVKLKDIMPRNPTLN